MILFLGLFTFSIMILIRYVFVNQHEAYVARENYKISRDDYLELLVNLSRLSPEETDVLVKSCDEWLKNKEKK